LAIISKIYMARGDYEMALVYIKQSLTIMQQKSATRMEKEQH